MNPIKPMLAVTGQPFSAPGWIFEPKIDGTRCIAQVFDRVVLTNRRLTDITYRYPELAEALAQTAPGCILDGEIAVFSDGKPDFAALSQREHQSTKLRIDYLSKVLPSSYVVFDALYARGRNVMSRPLGERKEILKDLVQETDLISVIDYFPDQGERYYQAALRMGIEGVMAKRLASPYQPGTRSSDWVKIKKRLKFDLVVGGYIPGLGQREPYFGGLLLGAYEQDKLVYVGRVGSGFSDKELAEIMRDFEPSSDSPFSNPPQTPGVKWLMPKLVVEVAAMEVTENESLRAPVFLRMREDKEPRECTRDQIKDQWFKPHQNL